jgi:AcrR family transcriptional regulator
MTSVETVDVHKFGSLQYSEAQMRVLTAALDLFAEHGVNGTSLQMIADDIGVTKAAVYHQFRTKEAIVVGAVEIELGNLEGALEAAEADAGGPEAVETLLNQVIKLAIGRRRLVGTLQHDPVIIRLLGDHQPFQQFMQRLFAVLLGGTFDSRSRVRAAMIAAAIGGAVTHPLVTDLDDETLRSELLGLTQRLLGSADSSMD